MDKVLEELGMKIAWVWFRYVAQVYIASESNEIICKKNVMLSLEVLYVSSGKLKRLGFGGTRYEDYVGMD